jgi:hypothetical protein
MKRPAIAILLFLSFSLLVALSDPAIGQSLDKMRLVYSGTGLNSYVLEMGRRTGIFRKNGLDLEVVYVSSGSLLNQAPIAGTFERILFLGLRGDDNEAQGRGYAHHCSGGEPLQPRLPSGSGNYFNQVTQG